MRVLGWHGGLLRSDRDATAGWSTHDSAAALLENGILVAAVEEERLDRIKHSNYFPARAIRRCLDIGGVNLDQIDAIALNFAERPRDVFPCDAGVPSPNAFLEDPSQLACDVREMVGALFSREFGADVSAKLFFCDHHDAHLWSAFAQSGFQDALVASFDGSGDCRSGRIGVAGPDGIATLREYPVGQSLGDLYSDSIRFIGYRRFDEYKVMGLAPYGDPERFRWLFGSMYRLLPDGEYALTNRADRWAAIVDAGLLPLARRAGAPFADVHKDFAAALQEALEQIATHALAHFRETTRASNLCLAGGVAHNCTLTGRLLQQGGYAAMFVQPASHDAGGAIGAAIAVQNALAGPGNRAPLTHVFYGGDIGTDDAVKQALDGWGALLRVERMADVAAEAAEILADGLVIGWVQGRSEFGPRALGHRSILADPRPAQNTTRINRMIKKRESYRPFAPAILAEEIDCLVEVPATYADLSYMTYTLPVRPARRGELGAVTHIDGSARVQSVSHESNPEFWALIRKFQHLTGVPALLNTSFNNDVEPIVDSVDDAVTCFLTTDLDALVVGNYVARKASTPPDFGAVETLRIFVPESRKLVRRRRVTGEVEYALESTASHHFMRRQVEISAPMFAALAAADEPTLVGQLFVRASFASDQLWSDVVEELLALWSRRAIALRP